MRGPECRRASQRLRRQQGEPVPAYSRRSQGLHGPGKRGIDLAAPKGTPTLASAGGTVLLARNGWN